MQVVIPSLCVIGGSRYFSTIHSLLSLVADKVKDNEYLYSYYTLILNLLELLISTHEKQPPTMESLELQMLKA